MVEFTDSYERSVAAAGDALAAGDPASLARAETLYRQAIAAGEQAFGEPELSLLPAIAGLGSTLILANRLEEAEAIVDRAISLGEQMGADHPDFVILLNDLSRLYLKQSAHRYAEPLLQRLLEIKRVKGEEHPEVATVLASLASVRQVLGRYEEAEQLWRRVLQIRERTLAPNHFAIATAIEQLGGTCAARGKVHEALELFQRALTMRELTLGPDHASLRPARERIADLQLQASEDSLESAPIVLASAPTRLPIPRVSIPAAPPPSPVVAPPPAPRKSPAAPKPRMDVAAPAHEETHVMEREASPAQVVFPVSSALTVTEPAQPPAVPYMNVLMDIKDEFEEPDAEAAPAPGGNALLASIALAFRERRAVAIATTAAIVLPLTAAGVYFAMSANRGPVWATQSGFAANTVAPDSTMRPALPTAAALGLEATRDSAAHAAALAAATKGKQPEPGRRISESNSDEPIRIPVITRPASSRLDSVVGAINVPSQSIGESYRVQLQASLAGGRESVSELQPSIPARRAQLIGAPPVPRYPSGLAQRGVGGVVRVRFDVDTLGKPLMSTFAVISSPHPSLSTAVRNVIPNMRFEPARTQGPVVRTITESVEQSFTFNPRGENNENTEMN